MNQMSFDRSLLHFQKKRENLKIKRTNDLALDVQETNDGIRPGSVKHVDERQLFFDDNDFKD